MSTLNRAAIVSNPALRAEYNRFAEATGRKGYAFCTAADIEQFLLWRDGKDVTPAQPAAQPAGDVTEAMKALIKAVGLTTEVDWAKIEASIDRKVKAAAESMTAKLEISVAKQPPVIVDNSFPALPEILKYLANGENVWLYGPSGSGKTTMAQKAIAKAFGFAEHEVRVVSCYYQLAKAEIFGGAVNATTTTEGALSGAKVVIFDEVTKLHPSVAGALNHLLQEREYRHWSTGEVISCKDIMFLATSNILFGESAVYNGNAKQDASLMQRFSCKRFIGYNESFEKQSAADLPSVITEVFHDIRRLATGAKMTEVISTRDFLAICKSVRFGVPAAVAFDTVLGFGEADKAQDYGMGWSVDKLDKIKWAEQKRKLQGF